MPCIGNVPVIVASGSISQPDGGDLSATTLFTPSASGLFLVTLYISCAVTSGTIAFTYTDSLASRNLAPGLVARGTYTWLFDSVADVPFTFAWDDNGSGSEYGFNIDYVVEQLG
jgi:hypothetical protein